jgi:polyhydroxyalkanoate synthesis regulator phasin
MSADAADTNAQDASQATLRRIDELTSRLDRAAEQLRSGELSADAAATVVEDCAALATEASGELERLAHAQSSPRVPGQDSLL